jgi:hypothetical protein
MSLDGQPSLRRLGGMLHCQIRRDSIELLERYFAENMRGFPSVFALRGKWRAHPQGTLLEVRFTLRAWVIGGLIASAIIALVTAIMQIANILHDAHPTFSGFPPGLGILQNKQSDSLMTLVMATTPMSQAYQVRENSS